MEPISLHRSNGASDEELLRRIKTRDDRAALKTLFERYYEQLCLYSASITRSDENAEEAVADVFAVLWLRRAELEIRTGVRPYLFGAVRNQSLNALRSPGVPAESIEEDAGFPADPDYDADRLLSFHDLQSGINALLERMPPRRRLIFRMSRLDGLSYQEIADSLSISVSTVQNQMVEAVKFLSQYSSRLF